MEVLRIEKGLVLGASKMEEDHHKSDPKHRRWSINKEEKGKPSQSKMSHIPILCKPMEGPSFPIWLSWRKELSFQLLSKLLDFTS